MPEPTSSPSAAELLAEIDRLRARVAALAPSEPERATRRRALRLAGGATAAAVVGTAATARPAAANDPNDVVKNVSNAVTATTTLTGSVNGSLLSLTNGSAGTSARGLYATSGAQDVAAVRGDNSNDTGIGGIGVGGYAPGGRDLFAFGSGRIGLNPHSFNAATNDYTTGEIHHLNGTLYCMVNSTTRRSVVGPGTTGALYPIAAARVYDSRSAAPNPGRLAGGAARVVFVGDGRNRASGAVDAANVVPAGATAVQYAISAWNTNGARGQLSVCAGNQVNTPSHVVLTWSRSATDATSVSFSRLDASRQLRLALFGQPTTNTHVSVDVIGYYL